MFRISMSGLFAGVSCPLLIQYDVRFSCSDVQFSCELFTGVKALYGRLSQASLFF